MPTWRETPGQVASARPRHFFQQPVLIQLAVVEALTIGVLSIALAILDDAEPGAFALVKLAGACALGLFAVYAVVEAGAASRSPQPPPAGRGPAPRPTAIIPAYLPNEAPIIVETLMHHLTTGPSNLQLILAYNSPHFLPIEEDLWRLADDHPRLTLLRVEDSRSKADNINAAVDIATGDVIGVFDADHHPAADGYARANRWLAAGADVVQGRCVVRRPEGPKPSLLAMAVTAEFEQMYSVGHPGRTRLTGIGLFGGSNGYWKAEALRSIRFDATALTEDIDASVRLLRMGGRIATDPGIVSAELAPPTLTSLCSQRLRWAQGWFQVGRRHLAGVMADRGLTVRKRLGVFWLWGWGTILPWIGALSLPLTLHGWFHQDRSPYSGAIRDILLFSTVAFLIHVGVAYRTAVSARRRLVFAAYVLANVIFYGYLRVALSRLGHLHELAGRTAWMVTPRAAAAPADTRIASHEDLLPRVAGLVTGLPSSDRLVPDLSGAHPATRSA